MLPARNYEPPFVRIARTGEMRAVTNLCVEAVKSGPYPNLVPDKDKIFNVVRECISGPAHFVHVVEDNGELVGVIMAHVSPILMYERDQASVIQFYSREPRYEVKLMVAFLRWARSRRKIKSIIFVVEYGVDPRVPKLLKRVGLNEVLPVYMETR